MRPIANASGAARAENSALHAKIAQSGLDYLALGHVHVFTELSQGTTKACYPGTPAPLHLGVHDGGSVALVTLDPDSGVTLVQRKIVL